MRNCPVCENAEITSEMSSCPACDSDLESFAIIEDIDQSIHKQKKVKLSLVGGLVIALAGLVIVSANNEAEASGATIIEVTSTESQELIDQLSLENEQLKTTIRELNQQPEEAVPEQQDVAEAAVEEVVEETETVLAGDVKTHVIQDNETLWKIAEMYLGAGHRYLEIAEFNEMHHDSIFAGMEIKIKIK